jgi:hypothetical protein
MLRGADIGFLTRFLTNDLDIGLNGSGRSDY